MTIVGQPLVGDRGRERSGGVADPAAGRVGLKGERGAHLGHDKHERRRSSDEDTRCGTGRKRCWAPPDRSPSTRTGTERPNRAGPCGFQRGFAHSTLVRSRASVRTCRGRQTAAAPRGD